MEAKTGSQETPKRNTRIVTDDYIAEVIVDDTASSEVFHWFVRRRTNFEVVILGEKSSHESALQEAQDHLDRLSEEGRVAEAVEHHHSAGA